MLEYTVRGHGFEKSIDAMRFLIDIKRNMRIKQFDKDQPFSSHEWMRLANDFLALSEMCRRQPTRLFEHYPSLAIEYATEAIKNAHIGTNKIVLRDFIKSYINNFDLNAYLHILEG